MTHVRITGSYRGYEINNVVFELKDAAKPMTASQKDKGCMNFQVHAGTEFKEFGPIIGIRSVKPGNYELISADGENYVDDFVPYVADVLDDAPVETDDEIMDRTRARFDILRDMMRACVDQLIRGMVVSGPPGVGKSYDVEKMIDEATVLGKLGDKGDNCPKYSVIKGSMTPAALYSILYQHSSKGSVLVFDDSDSILHDAKSLNMLKSVMDTGKTRRLTWGAVSGPMANNPDLPDTFEFQGAVVFITNLDFDDARGQIGTHLEAIKSRSHDLDMAMDTTREKFLRCKQIVIDGMLSSYGFSTEAELEILDFIETNIDNLQELSLRTVRKIADLKLVNDAEWRNIAEVTILRRGGKKKNR
jgi:hypothetical protein